MQQLIGVAILSFALMLSSAAGAAGKLSCQAASEHRPGTGPEGMFAKLQPLFASPAEYRQWLGQCLLPADQFTRTESAYVVIDTRDAVDYDKGHLPRAINMPLSAIKTRLFLKGKNLLLLGEPQRRVAAINSCKNLNRSGFARVKVLRGGYSEFSRKRSGENFQAAPTSVFTVAVENLIYESRYDPWIIIDLSLQGAGRLDRHFDDIYRLNAYPSSAQMTEMIASAKAAAGIGASARFIVIDKAGSDPRQFENWLRNVGDSQGQHRLFYLKGGLKAFDAYSKKQQIMLSKSDLLLNRPPGCRQ